MNNRSEHQSRDSLCSVQCPGLDETSPPNFCLSATAQPMLSALSGPRDDLCASLHECFIRNRRMRHAYEYWLGLQYSHRMNYIYLTGRWLTSKGHQPVCKISESSANKSCLKLSFPMRFWILLMSDMLYWYFYIFWNKSQVLIVLKLIHAPDLNTLISPMMVT